MKKIRLTESDLHRLIKESIKQVLKETRLDYDEDNFSGRYSKTSSEDFIDTDGYLDDPYNKPNSWDDEGWIDGDRDMENEYSWDLFDRKPIAHGAGGYYQVSKAGVPKDIEDSHNTRKFKDDDYHTFGKRQMNGWTKGRIPTEDLGDNWLDAKDTKRF